MSVTHRVKCLMCRISQNQPLNNWNVDDVPNIPWIRSLSLNNFIKSVNQN